jgi:ABC-type uncharacterized transport system substrate-binding protein
MNRITGKSWFIVAFVNFFLFQASFIFAHPHMELEYTVEIISGSKGPQDAVVTWYLDQYFSASIIGDYDQDGNGISAKESSLIEKEAFSNLKNYGYFILFRTAKGRFAPNSVKNFRASRKANQLIYTFTVALDLVAREDEFWLAVFDQTYFCATKMKEKGFSLSGEGIDKLEISAGINQKHPVYYNPYGKVNDNTIYSTWRAGLEIAYPEEIHIRKK